MSTRSRIGITNPDGTITSIYCHFDGYWRGVGQMLIKYYNSEERARAVVNIGYVSSLQKTFARTMFEQRHDGSPMDQLHHADAQDYFGYSQIHSWCEFVYLWKDGRWLGSRVGGACGPFMAREDATEMWCRLKLVPKSE